MKKKKGTRARSNRSAGKRVKWKTAKPAPAMPEKRAKWDEASDFAAKYGVAPQIVYKGDTDALKIPPPNHVLFDPTAPKTFDPIRVSAIDRDGKMTTPIEVWTDPDIGTLWVLDGRGRTLDVREVNRRRRAEGRELVQPYIVPFMGDERHAVARVREKNYHRRSPTPSGMAMDLRVLRNYGYSWDACARILHHDTNDAEQWGRRLLPIAFCIPDVQEAIDAGKITRGVARRFGGSAPDGSRALGKRDQLELLDKLLLKGTEERGSKPVSPKYRVRIAAALSNGAASVLRGTEGVVAKAIAAAMARIDGDARALKPWPHVARIFEEALQPLPRGPKPRSVET